MRESLDHALADKAEKMAAVRGFEKRVLVLLNVYFFGDDPEAASVMLAELAPSYGVFDRVYLLEARRGLGLIYAKRSSTTEQGVGRVDVLVHDYLQHSTSTVNFFARSATSAADRSFHISDFFLRVFLAMFLAIKTHDVPLAAFLRPVVWLDHK